MPYREDDSIDFDILKKEVDYLFDAGADGITLALASELLRLTQSERLELSRILPQMVEKRGTVTLSVGSETTKEAVFYAEVAQASGADAVMAIPPVATHATETEKYEYYRALHDAVTIPLVVQDASGYLGQGLSVETQARLRAELGPRIYFKPEAEPVGPTLTALQKAMGNEAIIFEGSGGIYLIDAYWRGISGTMPGSDVIRGIVAIWEALESGNNDRAYQIFFPLSCIISLQLASLDTYLAIEKYLLVKQGVFKTDRIRPPTAYHLDSHTAAEVDRLFGYLEAVL